MKKATITISYDEEKLSALNMYLAQKGVQVETELERSLETMYTKTVPAGVREFIEMKSGNPSKATPAKKVKSSSFSAVGADGKEVKPNAQP